MIGFTGIFRINKNEYNEFFDSGSIEEFTQKCTESKTVDWAWLFEAKTGRPIARYTRKDGVLVFGALVDFERTEGYEDVAPGLIVDEVLQYHICSEREPWPFTILNDHDEGEVEK